MMRSIVEVPLRGAPPMPNPVRCYGCTKPHYLSEMPRLTRATRTTKTGSAFTCTRCGKVNYVIDQP